MSPRPIANSERTNVFFSPEVMEQLRTLAAKKGRIDESVLSESKADLVEKLRLTNAGHYTNAAMLLFSKDSDKWQLGSYTKIGFFETDADLRYQDEIHGSILEQIDKIRSWCMSQAAICRDLC